MSKPNNRIALIGWSIIAAVAVTFFATMSQAAEDPYAEVGYLHEDAVMDVWNDFFTEEQQLLAVKIGYNCSYITTATSAILKGADGRLVEVADILIDELVDCKQLHPDAQLEALIETGFTPVPYFTDGVRDLDPEDFFTTLKKDGFKTVAICVAEVYLVTIFLPSSDSVHEELAIARVLSRHCEPVTSD